jgi:hypothetical protein
VNGERRAKSGLDADHGPDDGLNGAFEKRLFGSDAADFAKVIVRYAQAELIRHGEEFHG